MNFGSGKAETLGMRRNLEAAPVPLHDVVVADGALVPEAADAIEVGRSGTPGFFRFTRRAAEAAVVIGQDVAQNFVGSIEIGRAGQAQLAGEAVLKRAPEAFDAALGLRTAGGDVADAELSQGAAELGGLSFACELFFHRPVIVVAHEDAVTVSVKAERDAVAAQQAAEQAEIAAGVFGGTELGDQDFASGVVQEGQQGEFGAASFQPAVEAGVEPKHFAFASAGQTSLTMRGSAPFAGRANSRAAQKTAEGLAAEGKTFDLTEFLAEMVIVEARVARAGQIENAGAGALGEA